MLGGENDYYGGGCNEHGKKTNIQVQSLECEKLILNQAAFERPCMATKDTKQYDGLLQWHYEGLAAEEKFLFQLKENQKIKNGDTFPCHVNCNQSIYSYNDLKRVKNLGTLWTILGAVLFAKHSFFQPFGILECCFNFSCSLYICVVSRWNILFSTLQGKMLSSEMVRVSVQILFPNLLDCRFSDVCVPVALLSEKTKYFYMDFFRRKSKITGWLFR